MIISRALATAALGAVALSGCGAATITPTVTRRLGHHTARRAHRGVRGRSVGRRHKAARRHTVERRPARVSGRPVGLVVSHVSGSSVQPQPAPGSCQARGRGPFSLPDPRCTPGALSPTVKRADLSSTICRSGYTETVRPSESITEREKQASLGSYGDSGPLHIYEYDHLVPLELGGAPNDPRNLWPEPGGSPNPKDRLENRLRELVCAGQLPLAVAQREIARDWVAVYRRLYGSG